MIYFYAEELILQQINHESRLREERDQTHKIYTNSPFLRGYIQSSLPTIKENTLITLNYKPYTIKTLSYTLQESQLTCSSILHLHPTNQNHCTHTTKAIIPYNSTKINKLNELLYTKTPLQDICNSRKNTFHGRNIIPVKRKPQLKIMWWHF